MQRAACAFDCGEIHKRITSAWNRKSYYGAFLFLAQSVCDFLAQMWGSVNFVYTFCTQTWATVIWLMCVNLYNPCWRIYDNVLRHSCSIWFSSTYISLQIGRYYDIFVSSIFREDGWRCDTRTCPLNEGYVGACVVCSVLCVSVCVCAVRADADGCDKLKRTMRIWCCTSSCFVNHGHDSINFQRIFSLQ